MTAEELMRMMASDPELRVAKRQREIAWAEKGWRLDLAEQPILRDLAAVGVRVRSVWDLLERHDYDDAIPILLRHLRGGYPSRVLEGMARALGEPAARPYWDEMVRIYAEGAEWGKDLDDDLPQGNLREGMAVALMAISRKEDVSRLETLIRNREFGQSRGFFIDALLKVAKPEALCIFRDLRDDPDLGDEIRRILERAEKRRTRQRSRALLKKSESQQREK